MHRRDFLGTLSATSIVPLLPSARWTWAAEAIEGSGAVEPRAATTAAPRCWAWWGWEPLEHYRRTGGNVGAVDASATWLTDWYDRLHSEELVATMAGLGVNLIVTHFFKGFGLAHERDAQQRTRSLVQCAHRHGVRALGYCQSRSLYYEAFLVEQPDAESWVQRDEAGQPRTWSSAYYRWAPCIQSDEFRRYLKRVIRVGLEDIGLDGLHFDNDYAEPCYCSRCTAEFRRWLTARFPDPQEHFGLPSFDQIRPPPTQSPTWINDPLVQQWVRYRCEALGDYHRDLTAYARGIRPAAILLGNPGHPRSFDAPYRISVWAPTVGQHLDLMFAENGNFPGMVDGAMISQIRAYKQARALGYRVVSTTWRRGRAGLAELPETAEEISLQIAEAAANGGVPGTNWALRPLGDGDRMRIDRPELREALARSLRFVHAHADLTNATRPIRNVAVLRTFASLAFDTRGSWARVLGAEEALIRNGFAWETLFGDDLGRLKEHDVLVLAGQSHLSDDECRAIRDFVTHGGGLVIAGANGQMNENGRLRGAGGLTDLDGDRVVRVEDDAVLSAAKGGYEIRVPLPRGGQKLCRAVETALDGRTAVRLRGADTVAISAYHAERGGLVVHAVNYATPQVAEGLRLELGSAWKAGSSARWLDLDGPPQQLTVADRPDGQSIELPPLRTYGILVI